MKKIQLDTGVREYRINDKGVLRFNPSDPNLYIRFQNITERLNSLTLDESLEPVEQLRSLDRQMKEVLSWVFGQENDFDKILGGVSLLAVTPNGKRVMNNLLEALEGILEDGIRRYADSMTQQALSAAQQRRNQC